MQERNLNLNLMILEVIILINSIIDLDLIFLVIKVLNNIIILLPQLIEEDILNIIMKVSLYLSFMTN